MDREVNTEENPSPSGSSPRWGNNTKLIVGLSVVALLAALLVNFRQIIGPVLLAFILAYLIQPIAAQLGEAARLNWRASVNVVYLVVLVVLVSLITIAGLALVQQSQALIAFVERFVSDLPATVEQLSGQQIAFGPFRLDLSRLDLPSIVQELLGMVQPIVGQAGTMVGRFAASAASTLGWVLFILLVSYFLLSESGRFREDLVHITIPGYDADSRRLVRELTIIWDSFLRGQLLISILIVVSYYILLNILGTRLSMAIALMAGVSAFVPYVGPLITWVVVAIIAYLQPGNYFGLEPTTYVIVVVAACLILNQIFDSYITPRVMGQALGVHPAGVLIAAIVATNLIGLIGLVLAAPVLATGTLLMRYIARKMLDMDPWPIVEVRPREIIPIWVRVSRRLQAAWRLLLRWLAQLQHTARR
jgi:predicted PurR-regulated permease PerM